MKCPWQERPNGPVFPSCIKSQHPQPPPDRSNLAPFTGVEKKQKLPLQDHRNGQSLSLKGDGGEFGPIHQSYLGFRQQAGRMLVLGRSQPATSPTSPRRASPSQDAEGVCANSGPLPGERKGEAGAIKLVQVLKTHPGRVLGVQRSSEGCKALRSLREKRGQASLPQVPGHPPWGQELPVLWLKGLANCHAKDARIALLRPPPLPALCPVVLPKGQPREDACRLVEGAEW